MNDELIGNYKILQKIGAGGMAKVYLAVHKDVPNLKVILKILTDSRLVDRFRQEADKLALLDGNPHICRIKHFFNHGENIVIAMEYIDGETLDDRIKRSGKLTIDESLRIVRDVLGVLEFAHHKGISHRDIKPGNIMIDSSGNVKVIDFGIAKAETDPSLTLAGSACGTPAYMAPEQFTPTDNTNYTLIDIYAVGITLYYMLSGELPFKGENEFAIRDAKLFSDPPPLKEKVSGISKNIDRIVMSAMSKNPLDRFASASDMIKEIDSVLSQETPKTMAAVEPTPGKVVKKSGSPIKMIAAAAVVIAAAIVAYVLFSGKSLAPPVLVYPDDNSSISDRKPTFRWEGSGQANYNLEYANNSDFLIPWQVNNLTGNSHTAAYELDAGEYYWKVQSVVDGETGEFSPVYTFLIESPEVTGRLEITVTPSGDIYVDDALIESDAAGATVTLDTGAHSIYVSNDGAVNKEIRDNVTLTPDTTILRSYTFRFPSAQPAKPTPAKPAAAYGELKVGSKPTIGADIYIDGKLQSRKTPTAIQLKPGRYSVRAVLDMDGTPKELLETVTVTADSSARIMFDFEK